MRQRNIGIISMVLLLIATLSFGCKTEESAAAETLLTATVQRGTLSIDVTASGNLALSQTADLAFDVSGYVYRVAVEAGDPVTDGELVAEVDTFDWEQQKRSLERSVVQAKISLNSAIISLEKAQNPTTTTSTISGAVSAPDPLDVESKQLSVEQARMSLDDAQQELDRYLETSAQILAPFDGFVTAVNVKGGDEVFKGAVAVSIADPTKFEANILINETDINNIQVGMPATVQVVASPTSVFPAQVTAISPTATNDSGVVNYKVKIELSTDEISKVNTSQIQEDKSSQTGEPPAAEPQSEQTSPPQLPPGQSPAEQPSKQTTAGSSQSAATEALTVEQLRDGLSVTITIVIQQKQDVLMIPSRAITQQGGQSTVRVLTGDVFEQRVVTTGISNTQYTEITGGLSEGEKVVIQTTASTTATTNQSSSPMGGPPDGGGGPPPF